MAGYTGLIIVMVTSIFLILTLLYSHYYFPVSLSLTHKNLECLLSTLLIIHLSFSSLPSEVCGGHSFLLRCHSIVQIDVATRTTAPLQPHEEGMGERRKGEGVSDRNRE